MKRQTLLRSLAVSILTGGLVAGCSHNESPETITMGHNTPPMVSAADVVPVGAVVTEVPTTQVARPATQPGVYPSMTPVVQQVVNTSTSPATKQVVYPSVTPVAKQVVAPPAVKQVVYTTPAPAPRKADGPTLGKGPVQRPAATADAKPNFPRGEQPAPHHAVVDITAASSFGHAPDYSWLSGQVEHSRLANGWRLRYASVDESDAHGGSVSLAGDVHLNGLQDGQHVRVMGHLQNSDNKDLAPAYHVDSFEVIDPSK